MVVQPPNFAAYANPNFGLALGQQIADLPEAYMKGREMKRMRASQQPIIDPNTGQPSEDPNTIVRQRLGLGGDYAEKMLPFLYGNKWMQQNAGLQPPSMEGNEPAPTPAPFARGAAAQPAQASQPRYSSSGADNSGDQTFLANVATKVFGERDVSPLIGRYAKALGIDPSDSLTPEQEQQAEKWMRNSAATMGAAPASSEVSRPAEAISAAEVGNNVGGAGPSLAGGPPSGGPAPVGGTAPTALAQAGGGRANVDAAGAAGGPVTAFTQWDARQRAMLPDQTTGLPPGYTEKTAARWYSLGDQKSNIANGLAVTGNKAQAEQVKSQADHAYGMAQKIRDAIKERAAFTNEQKIARDPAIPEFERGKALGTEMGKAQAGVLKEYVDAGRSAQKRIQSLDTIGDALKRGGGNITTGPFAEHTLHAKQALSSLFNIDFAGTPEAEVAQKTGFSLATQAVKEISQRPSQMEFRLAMQNNPGLLLTPKGSFMMIDVLKQTARQDIELAKLAQRRENWDNWQDISDKYYKEHPLKSPFDRSKNIGMDDLKAIGGDVPSPTAPTHKAADKAAYDALPKGAIFTGPDGKQWRKP
jgi:hypothetical protein